jgi:hypothetical protein
MAEITNIIVSYANISYPSIINIQYREELVSHEVPNNNICFVTKKKEFII